MGYNLSSSPHIRGQESTGSIMFDVCLALLPATAFGVYRFGIYSLLVLIVSIAFAVLSEYMYQNLTGQKVLIGDGSALLTGLLLGLNMPPQAPLWMPALGSMFAIIFVKQFFGGLGRNFVNPALGARCFLLISFTSLMSDFTVDSVSGATPLALLKSGSRVDVAAMFVGLTSGTIGEVSAIALLIGGIYLLVKKVITWEIPVCYIGSFVIFITLFGGNGFDTKFILAHLCGGGLMLGAWFMATDYVTSPITPKGKIVFGVLCGVLTGIFRIFGVSAEGVSYAIIISNLVVPLIEKVTMPKAFGLEKVKKAKPAKAEAAPEAAEEKAPAAAAEKAPVSMKVYRAALNLCTITLIAGLALGIVYKLTEEPIKKAELAAQAKAFASVCPQAASFDEYPELMEKIGEQAGDVIVESAYKSLDASGAMNGCVVNVLDKNGFGGEIEISVGFDADGVITGVEFLTINETAGLGMNATKDEFRGQFIGKSVDSFTVTKTGASADNEIDALSGATITSNAVTAGINGALAAVQAMK